MAMFPPFPGEPFLTFAPPDYEKEWNLIIRNVVLTSILFLVVLPSFIKSLYNMETKDLCDDESLDESSLAGVKETLDESGQRRMKIISTTTTTTTNTPTTFNKSNTRNISTVIRRKAVTSASKCSIKKADSASSSKNKLTKNGTKKNQKRSKSSGGERNVNKTGDEKQQEKDSTPAKSKQVPSIFLYLLNIVYLFVIFLLIFHSPNNVATARRVFLAPLLKINECQEIIEMATRAASRATVKAESDLTLMALSNGNVNGDVNLPDEIGVTDENSQRINRTKIKALKKLLKQPSGWRKDRHTSYPTTDLSVVVEFEDDDKNYLRKILDARLSPVLERIYGVKRESIRANDMFVVRYDENGQNKLGKHTDSSHISFNILLNDEFEGGGTRFYNGLEAAATIVDSNQNEDYTSSGIQRSKLWEDARPRPGQVLINNAMVVHEGLPTTKGTRYILVGFMNIDTKNPFYISQKWDVSWFSTWLSFPWLTVTFKEGLQTIIERSQKKAAKQRAEARREQVEGNPEGNGTSSNKEEDNYVAPSPSAMSSRGFDSPKLSKNYYINGLLTQLTIQFGLLGDMNAPHGIVQLINDKEHSNEYIDALDEFHKIYSDRLARSNWFAGQQVHLNIDGTIASEWGERSRSSDKFYDPEF